MIFEKDIKDQKRRFNLHRKHYDKENVKYLNEDEAYLDFLNESKSVGLNNWDEDLPGWAALPFQPYVTKPKTDHNITILDRIPKVDNLGNDDLNIKHFVVEIGKDINEKK